MFGMFAKTDKISGKMVNFLNKVDEEYMLAYNTKTIRGLQEYISRECGISVSQKIHGVGSRYFGAAKFRNTKWQLQSKEGNSYTILKSVVFDKITVAGAMRMSVANDYQEIWVVNADDKKMIVTAITAA